MVGNRGTGGIPFVFVTGLIRSGTTWIGRLLASAPKTLYIHEPFNPDSLWNHAIPTPVQHMYLNQLNGGPYIHLFHRILLIDPVLKGKTRIETGKLIHEFIENQEEIHGPRHTLKPMKKDPTALFLSEWVADNFNTRPLVILLHPVSVAKSLLRLGWGNFNPRHFLVQPLLLERFFNEEEVHQLEEYHREPTSDAVMRAVLSVVWLYKAILVYRHDRPDWIYVSYERFLSDPRKHAEWLFRETGLTFSNATHEALHGPGEKEYDPQAAHQSTIKPIVSKTEDLFAPTDHVQDWRSIHEEHFSPIEEALGDLVSWS